MKDLVIREALDKNINGIVEVLKSIYLQDEAWARRALKKLLTTKNYFILVAEFKGAITGFIDYYVLPSIHEKWNEATINYFFVHKSYQGKGIGSKLLIEVVRRADEMELGEIHVATEKNNRRAIRLYKKYGFAKEYLLLQRTRETEQFASPET